MVPPDIPLLQRNMGVGVGVVGVVVLFFLSLLLVPCGGWEWLDSSQLLPGLTFFASVWARRIDLLLVVVVVWFVVSSSSFDRPFNGPVQWCMKDEG